MIPWRKIRGPTLEKRLADLEVGIDAWTDYQLATSRYVKELYETMLGQQQTINALLDVLGPLADKSAALVRQTNTLTEEANAQKREIAQLQAALVGMSAKARRS